MKIERMNKGPWGKVQAFFDVMTEEGFTIKGFKIIEGINGLFVSMPSQKGKDDEYFDTVYLAQELREQLTQLALQKFGMDNDSPDNFSFPKKQQVQATVPNEESPQIIEKATKEVDSAEPATYSDDDIPF